MRKIVTILFLISLIVFACSKSDKEKVELKVGEPAYELALELSQKLPFLAPDSNVVLVSTNSFEITANEVIKRIYQDRGSYSDRLKQMPDASIKQTIIRTAKGLADQKLLLQEVEDTGIKVTQAEIDTFLSQQYKQAGGEDKFKERFTKMSVEYNHILTGIRHTLEIEKYLNETFAKELEPSEEEIQEAYKNNKTVTVRHILFMTQGKKAEEKKEILEKAKKILKKAKAGADFIELAKKYSEDPGSKKNGGLYENFGPGAMVKPFEDASFSVPIGEISDIVETQYGYHIVKVIDRKEETRPIDEIREELKKKVIQKKQSKKNMLFRDHIKLLQEKAGYVEKQV